MSKLRKRKAKSVKKGFIPTRVPKEVSNIQGQTIAREIALGLEYCQSKQFDRAEACFQQVLRWQPDHPDAWHLLGVIAAQRQEYETAIEWIEKAIALNPQEAVFYNNLGNALKHQGNLEAAIASYQQALQLNPSYADAHSNLGNALKQQGNLEAAIASYQQALQLNPNSAKTHYILGNLLKDRGQLTAASACYQHAIAIDPDLVEAYNNLGIALKAQGKLTEAMTFYQRALALAPNQEKLRSNWLFSLHYCPDFTPDAIFREHQQWRQHHALPLAASIQPHNNDRNTERRLRIGYVSGDFRTHSVAYFLEPLMAAHNHRDFEIFCYANNSLTDAITERMRGSSDNWREIATLDDEQVANAIREDAIDILVDLSGHTRDNRLLVFARKPAPIQVTYLGYPNTTGLETIDYRFVDAKTDPQGQSEPLNTEQLVRLPHSFLCYQPPADSPPVSPPPVLSSGHLTFGSFNNFPKVSPQLVADWAKILKAVPNSRLVLKSQSSGDLGTQDYVKGLFQQQDIDSERLELVGWLSETQQHLALYNQVDIALDPFPYNGTTTTCEALWMGVPVITRAGKTHVSRVGVSLLSSVGLEELIAESAEDYIQKAVALANNLERLQQLRGTLRERMAAAPLTNAPLIAQSLEDAYRQMWRRWCSPEESSQSVAITSSSLERDRIEQLDLGIRYYQSEQFQEAEACFQQVLQGQPDNADAWHLLGVIAARRQQYEVAIEWIEKAIKLKPTEALFYTNFGNIHLDREDFQYAIECYKKAIEIQPNYADAYKHLGIAYKKQKNFTRARECYQQVLQIQPDYSDAYISLGNVYHEQGRQIEAINYYQKALKLQPAHEIARGNLTTTLQYSNHYEPSAIFLAHQQFANSYSQPFLASIQTPSNDPNPERRLRIGYVSADFYSHSVASFFEPLLAAHNHHSFEIVCYSNNKKTDAITQQLKLLADRWREIHHLKDKEVAELIRQDAIDILVDLSGYMKGNRKLVFARKPAPIQIAYLGYPNTTGLATMDYRFTDERADPLGQTERWHTEELVRLPHGFLCYQPPADSLEVSSLPVLTNEQITFGSFNNLLKVTPELISYWATILKRIPDSRLLIKSKPLFDSETRNYVLEQFQQQAIEAERLELLGWLPDKSQHLALYNQVDIALDTFPYHGTTTTCEAMWMGVPVITLAGETHVSRVGASLLTSVGLEELIAESAEEYIQKAVDLANNIERLQQLRATLRDRMAASPLTNAPLIAQSIEDAYRQMWLHWCAKGASPSLPATATITPKSQPLDLPVEPNQPLIESDRDLIVSPVDRAKFILIKAWGYGFWSDIDHLLGQLLIAELTGRVPIVHWGDNSHYRNTGDENAFENYFEPISRYTIDDLLGHSYKFYPSKWSEANLKANNLNKWEGSDSRLSGSSLLSRGEDVVVSDFHCYLCDLIPWIDYHHFLAKKSPQDVYRYLFKKYLKLRPEIEQDIEKFWLEHLASHSTLAVHVRGSDKSKESRNLEQINQQYHQAIESYLERRPDTIIFLLTDETSILEDYQQKYGERLRYTNAARTSTGVGIHYQKQTSPQQLGIEIIKDIYLAAKCDYFIGNGHSNVSTTILHLKEWQQDRYLLLANNRLFHSIDISHKNNRNLQRSLHIGDVSGTLRNHSFELQEFQGKKLISFSLWGDNPKYTVGAIRNAELAPIVYPGWICRFYIAQTVPQDIVSQLAQQPHVEIIKLNSEKDWEASLWRFYPAAEPDVGVMISRDTDSRLNWREKAAVEEWLKSDKPCHIMRDHPGHYSPIMAGMWGVKGGLFKDLRETIESYLRTAPRSYIDYGLDQMFLVNIIYPLVQDLSLVHDEFFVGLPFPVPRNNFKFVGQSFNANNIPNPIYTIQLANYLLLRSQSKRLKAEGFSQQALEKATGQPSTNGHIQQQIELGIQHWQLGRLEEANLCCQQVLQWQPNNLDAWNLWGVIAAQQQQYQTAIERINRAIALKPTEATFYSNLGNVYLEQKQFQPACECYQQALQLQPNDTDISKKFAVACEKLLDLGIEHHQAQRLSEAATSYQQILQYQLNRADAWHLWGVIASEEEDYATAIDRINRAISLSPNIASFYNSLGGVYQKQKKLDKAEQYYQKAVELQPKFEKAYINLGTALEERGQLEEAICCYQKALDIQPDSPDAQTGVGSILQQQGQLEAAVKSYQKALQLQPDNIVALKQYVWARRKICDWGGLAPFESSLVAATRSQHWAIPPFSLLTVTDDPAVLFAAAHNSCRNNIDSSFPPLWNGQQYAHKKIRLAYLSANFYEHAVAYLMAELFERHDRKRFEVYAISFSPEKNTPMRQRLVKAFDRFIDIRELSDLEAAQQIRDLEIDIAVDLQGYTKDCRPQIFAHRPAPIQVNYLGYAGTLGADFIDYILVDPFIVPSEQQPYFSEKLVHLPECYLPNDSQRFIAEATPSRQECGLPERGFVFCSFNNPYKITPVVFDIWMRLLKAIRYSVLWLFGQESASKENLRSYARTSGIDPDRLIFAPRTPTLAEHLARHRLADLFLDTLPYNAHTTASDALWAGLPVLTCAGKSFAGRVAGSLLHAIALPELVTYNLEDYEVMALKLATEPDLLGQIKEKLAQNRLKMPLFDGKRFRRHIEAAYTEMHAIAQRGEKPRAFALAPENEEGGLK